MIRVTNPFAKYFENVRFSSPGRGHFHGKWEAFRYWIPYYHQINEVLRLATPESRILEIGPGSGVTTDALRRLGLRVTTADVEPDSGADYVCDIRALSVGGDGFDIVCCFQVLEHIPFADFPTALTKLRGVTRRHCLISLPEPGVELGFAVKLPRIFPGWLFSPRKDYIPFSMKLALPAKMISCPEPGHQWEVGRRSFSRRTVEREIRLAGFRIARRFSLPLSMRFLFYVLERIDEQLPGGEFLPT